MLFRHIVIVGVGLIGGSFALASRQERLAERITGWGSRRDSLEKALTAGIIDGFEEAFDSGDISTADLIYLAAPVRAIIDFLRERAGSIKTGAIVTDAGSTKRDICLAARESLPEKVYFVGGHPMAGSHKSGSDFADANMFRGAFYALMSEEENEDLMSEQGEVLNKMVEMVKALGGVPVMTTPELHDRMVARVSHLPQLLSTALAGAIAKSSSPENVRLAGPGFSDMTRLAASRWSVWEDIFRTNADEIALALAEMTSEMEAIRLALESNEYTKLGDAFRLANEFLQSFHRMRQ